MKGVLVLSFIVFLFSYGYARENIKDVFKNNQAVIYTINIRNFGAVDNNNDGIINPKDGDISGSFLNAKEKLPVLKNEGINTVYLLPITLVGKLKALGTAGSLYAMDGFDGINPQLNDTDFKDIKEQAKLFVEYAHKPDMNVIVDLPGCGSYDLSFKKPDWFIFDEKNNSITPADWTDVRLFKIYDENKTLNQKTIENFKSFVDMTINLDFDGIRADVAALKPYEFWKNIIDYAKSKKGNFLFLAEASPDWSNPIAQNIENYTTINELLDAGFDSYYGSFSDFKNIKTKKEFDKKIETNLKILSKHKNKSIIGAFATHDQQAPILRGENYWDMVLWLNVTLPLNSYFLDGFSIGDDYIYDYENKKTTNSLTDDEYYFVHSGKMDIFNLTAPVRNKHPEFKQKYLKAIQFKNENKDFIKNAKYTTLKTNNERVFGYLLTYFNKKVIVIGSLDEDKNMEAFIKEDFLNKKYSLNALNTKKMPVKEKNKMTFFLEPLEIQVYEIEI